MKLIEVDAEWIAAALTFCVGIDTDVLRRGIVGQVARAKLESRERLFTPEIESALEVLGGKIGG